MSQLRWLKNERCLRRARLIMASTTNYFIKKRFDRFKLLSKSLVIFLKRDESVVSKLIYSQARSNIFQGHFDDDDVVRRKIKR